MVASLRFASLTLRSAHIHKRLAQAAILLRILSAQSSAPSKQSVDCRITQPLDSRLYPMRDSIMDGISRLGFSLLVGLPEQRNELILPVRGAVSSDDDSGLYGSSILVSEQDLHGMASILL
jgi:hypothetical protein